METRPVSGRRPTKQSIFGRLVVLIGVGPHQAADAHQADRHANNVDDLVAHFQDGPAEKQDNWNCKAVQKLDARQRRVLICLND